MIQIGALRYDNEAFSGSMNLREPDFVSYVV